MPAKKRAGKSPLMILKQQRDAKPTSRNILRFRGNSPSAKHFNAPASTLYLH